MFDLPKIEAELKRRAAWHLKQTHLLVDYYRVRRRLAYPLPVRAIHISEMKVRRDYSRDYPWPTWMTWALEERVAALCASAKLFDDAPAAEAAARDLEALAGWPTYRQYEKPDLSLGHAGRTLHHGFLWAKDRDERLRGKIREAFARIVEDTLPFSDKLHGSFKRPEDILTCEKPAAALHNIPIIGSVGAALAAMALGDSHRAAAETLNERLFALLGALLEMRAQGFTEGVAYDGYVLDFAADWLGALPEDRRAPILDHPRLNELFEQSYRLSAPGSAVDVAELSDVEAVEMPFHLSAQAKLQWMRLDPVRAWHLQRCDPARLRSEALLVLWGIGTVARTAQEPDFQRAMRAEAPPAGALDAHYALVLRSGWDANDVAVTIAASNSSMGHMHCDAGSLLIGTRGRWLVTDPGYQQYMNTREREYTLGAKAHNAPVINEKAQDRKGVKRLALEETNGVLRAELDLTACYPPELKLGSVDRAVWLVDKRIVIVGDRIRGEDVQSIDYYWHGHREAAWWVHERWARVYHPEAPDATVWIASPQARIQEAGVDRLPGSRGQMTLSAPADPSAKVIWWIFGIGAKPPEPKAEGTRLRLGDWLFDRA
ncbi:MAG: heparinase II/III family protein [Planctomycetota bacterium]|nr:heparinase II/III family protein [Planctomycetota bacterium]